MLAANVCVVLTHTHPEAPSPVRRHTLTDWEAGDALDARRAAGSASNPSSSVMGPVQHSDTPETDPEVSGDELREDSESQDEERQDGEREEEANDRALTVRDSSSPTAPTHGRPGPLVAPGDHDDIRQYYLSSNQDSTDSSDLEGEEFGLQLTVVEDNVHARTLSGAPPWDVRLPSQGSQRNVVNGNNVNGQSSGYSTPLPGIGHPSPLRSCPRAAVSSRKEGLNDRSDRIEESTEQKAPPPVARWASSKVWDAAPVSSVQNGALPANPKGTPARPGASSSSSSSLPSVGLLKRLEGRVRGSTPLGPVEPNVLAVSGGVGGGGESGAIVVGDGKRSTDALGVMDKEEEGGRMKPWVLAGLPEPGQASRRPIRLDKLTLEEEGFAKGRARNAEGGGGGGGDSSDDVREHNVTARMTPVNDVDVGKPSPSVRRLLEAAAGRSFDDPSQTSPRTSLFGDSETDGRSEEEGSRSFSGSFSDGDGEKASRAAHVLAGWVGIGMRPSMTEFATVPSLIERADYCPIPALVERRLVPVESSGPSSISAKFVETEDLTSIPPLKLRGWPPPKRVVAGEMEIQDVLMPAAAADMAGLVMEEEEPCGSSLALSPVVKGLHRRKAGSTGSSSWGEDAKRALAHKRLQWER